MMQSHANFDPGVPVVSGDGEQRIAQALNPVTFVYADGSNINGASVNGFALVNGRVALRHLKIGGAEAELAVWGKNITNRKDATFILNAGLSTSANYVQPRTYGIDLSFDF